MAATLFVRHKVADYDHWKRGYDALAAFRKASNVTAASVHRDAQDATIIVVTHQFKDAGAMMNFASSNELKSAMGNAGVVGKPEMWFGEDLEHTTH